MIDWQPTSPWTGIDLPMREGIVIVAEALSFARLRLLPGADFTGLPGPRQAQNGWLNMGPCEWLFCGNHCPRPDAIDMSDALVALSISGENVFDLLSAGIAIDWQRFSVGTCARMRLGETAVVLHRREEQQFRLIFGAPFARYLAEWLAHHV